MGSVNGKVALITGGANGVGAEVARRLHAKGAKLVLTDLDEGQLKEVAPRSARIGCSRLSPTCATCRRCRPPSSKGIERFGGIDIVMANAGIAHLRVGAASRSGGVQDTDRRQCGRRVPHRAGRPAVGDRSARLCADRVVGGGLSPPRRAWRRTTPSKAGVEHFANALRLEVAHHGVDVGSAHMSWIDTPLVRESKKPICRRSTKC